MRIGNHEFNRRPLIYIAGPYRSKLPWPLSLLGTLWNILRASYWAARLWRMGWAVICPHSMTAPLPLLSRHKLTWRDFIEGDIEIVRRCDALLYLAPSPGANIEYEVALSHGIPVFRPEDFKNRQGLVDPQVFMRFRT